jgi:hypothetical protein
MPRDTNEIKKKKKQFLGGPFAIQTTKVVHSHSSPATVERRLETG